MAPSPDDAAPPQGCLTVDAPRTDPDVKEIVTIDAEIAYDRCRLEVPLPASSSPQLSKDVMVGGRARLMLVSPLFPGSIEPISQEVQTIDSLGDEGTWAWQVRADKPGVHDLSLILSILGPEGEEVMIQNRRAEIMLLTKGTFSYYAGVVGHGITTFLTSIIGIITAGAVAVAAIVGIYFQISNRRAVKNPIESQSTQSLDN